MYGQYSIIEEGAHLEDGNHTASNQYYDEQRLRVSSQDHLNQEPLVSFQSSVHLNPSKYRMSGSKVSSGIGSDESVDISELSRLRAEAEEKGVLDSLDK